MKHGACLGAVGAALLLAGATRAEEKAAYNGPWEKASLSAGVFYSRVESQVRIGVGTRLGVDAENLLGLSPDETVFRLDGSWRFSDNRRHRLDLMWFSFRRAADGEFLEDFTVENEPGNPTVIPAGTAFNSFLNLDIYEAAYSYSFLQDDRIDLAVRGGLYVMPINLGVKAEGLLEAEGTRRFTAPLPVLGYRLDVALTPRWFIRTGSQVFYIEYEGFKGSLLQAQGALEFLPWKNLALGLGFDSLSLELKSRGKTYAGVDVNGSAEVAYRGLQLYLRTFFG